MNRVPLLWGFFRSCVKHTPLFLPSMTYPRTPLPPSFNLFSGKLPESSICEAAVAASAPKRPGGSALQAGDADHLEADFGEELHHVAVASERRDARRSPRTGTSGFIWRQVSTNLRRKDDDLGPKTNRSHAWNSAFRNRHFDDLTRVGTFNCSLVQLRSQMSQTNQPDTVLYSVSTCFRFGGIDSIRWEPTPGFLFLV